MTVKLEVGMKAKVVVDDGIFPKGEVVELTLIEADGAHQFKGKSGEWFLNADEYEWAETPTYVSTTYTGCKYITAGNLYEVVGERESGKLEIKCDDGDVILINVDRSGHINGGSWTVHDDIEIGTLKQLNVKPGDIVECVDDGGTSWWTEGGFYSVSADGTPKDDEGNFYGEYDDPQPGVRFRIISRASSPRTWSELTDAEKGALLLAHQKGEVIEYRYPFSQEWREVWGNDPSWIRGYSYRIKPAPVTEAVTLHGVIDDKNPYFERKATRYEYTHTITFTTTDGKPDLDSVRMEEA